MTGSVEMETGTVKWYDEKIGYGVILRDQGGEVYVHYSAINCEEGDCVLAPGRKVRFFVINSPRGLQAQNVVVLPDAGEEV